jgi:multiple sugar transport system substrate-binding protein
MKGRFLIFLAVILLASISLYAVELDFWHYWDGANGAKLEELVQRFNDEHKDITIKPIFVPGSSLLSKLQTAALSGRTPALAISDIIGMALVIGTGKLVNLSPFIKSDSFNLNDFYNELLVYGETEEGIFSLPVSTSNLGLFWNKEIFKEAGLDPNNPPETWEELLEYGKIIKEKTDKWGYELYTQGGEGTTWQWQVFLWGAGGEFLSPEKDYREAAFDSIAGVKALQFWVDLVNKYKISPMASWGLFGRGEAAMVMDGSWMVQFFPMQVNFELGSAPFPHPENGEYATNMGGEQIFMFNKTDQEEEAAWEFIKWFTNTNIQIEWDKATGFIPVKKSVANDKSYIAYIKNTNRLLLPFVESQKYARARPPVKEYPEISDIVAKEILKALQGRQTPEFSLRNAANKVNDLLSQQE